MTEQVNRADLETKVRAMYKDVAQNPHGEFHFEMGRAMARPARLHRRRGPGPLPAEAIESFAGVGYYFDLARSRRGEHVARSRQRLGHG